MKKETEILKILTSDFEYYGQQLNLNQLKLWVLDLLDLSSQEIERAVLENRRDAERRYPSNPAQIRDKVYMFPSAEEAWAMCKHDEKESVVWCSEIAEAYHDVRDLIKSGDMIGARMAFKDSYNKKVSISKSIKQKPKWFLSSGFDVEGRDIAMIEAINKGRVNEKQALELLPYLQLPSSKSNTQIAIAEKNSGLLEYESKEDKPLTEEEKEKNLLRISELKKSLESKNKMPKDEDEEKIQNKQQG